MFRTTLKSATAVLTTGNALSLDIGDPFSDRQLGPGIRGAGHGVRVDSTRKMPSMTRPRQPDLMLGCLFHFSFFYCTTCRFYSNIDRMAQADHVQAIVISQMLARQFSAGLLNENVSPCDLCLATRACAARASCAHSSRELCTLQILKKSLSLWEQEAAQEPRSEADRCSQTIPHATHSFSFRSNNG